MYHWKLADSKTCTNCNKECEDLRHFFFHCEIAKKIWSEVEQYLEHFWKVKVTITLENILLNKIDTKPCSVANFVCLITKQEMYSKRCLKEKLTTKNLFKRIKTLQGYERQQAIKNGKLKLHIQKWGENELNDYITEYIDRL